MLNKPTDLATLKACSIGDMTIEEKLLSKQCYWRKIRLSSYETIESAQVAAYILVVILATLVGLNSFVDEQVGKDVAMRVAAMNPIALDKDSVSQATIDNEIDVAKDLARQEVNLKIC